MYVDVWLSWLRGRIPFVSAIVLQNRRLHNSWKQPPFAKCSPVRRGWEGSATKKVLYSSSSEGGLLRRESVQFGWKGSTSLCCYISLWRPKIENRRIWESQNLRIAEFENRKTWELQDLRIAGFENHRNWESNNLRNYDSLVGQITAEKMTSFKENYDVVLKSGNKDAIWKMLNDIFKQ